MNLRSLFIKRHKLSYEGTQNEYFCETIRFTNIRHGAYCIPSMKDDGKGSKLPNFDQILMGNRRFGKLDGQQTVVTFRPGKNPVARTEIYTRGNSKHTVVVEEYDSARSVPILGQEFRTNESGVQTGLIKAFQVRHFGKVNVRQLMKVMAAEDFVTGPGQCTVSFDQIRDYDNITGISYNDDAGCAIEHIICEPTNKIKAVVFRSMLTNLGEIKPSTDDKFYLVNDDVPALKPGEIGMENLSQAVYGTTESLRLARQYFANFIKEHKGCLVEFDADKSKFTMTIDSHQLDRYLDTAEVEGILMDLARGREFALFVQPDAEAPAEASDDSKVTDAEEVSPA